MNESADRPARCRGEAARPGLTGALPGDAPPGERFEALRTAVAALEEVCRWQWNLVRQISEHLDRLPRDWPDANGPV